MTGWLEPVRLSLETAARPVPFFFRNDDVGWADARLFPLLELFAARELPLDLAVIPAALGDESARRLADRCAASGGRLRVHQHGWRHANHEHAGRKCEFGEARAAADQVADLRAGRARLQDMLGSVIDPIFTPPWNRCAQATVDLLAAESFRVLSRDVAAAPLNAEAVAELPVSIDWDRTMRREDRHDGLGRAIACAVAHGRPVGIMLHHAGMGEESRAALAALLDVLSSHGNARCLPMMDCAAAT